jgi:predicted RNA-binding protein with PUA domain
MFRYEGEFISNVFNNKVFDVKGGKDVEGQRLVVWNRHGGKNQRFKIVYDD